MTWWTRPFDTASLRADGRVEPARVMGWASATEVPPNLSTSTICLLMSCPPGGRRRNYLSAETRTRRRSKKKPAGWLAGGFCEVSCL